MHSEKVCPAPCRAWARQIACLNLVFGALRTRVRWVVSYVRDRTTGLRRRPMPAARPFLRLRACASARHFRFASSDRATSARGTCCPRDSGMEFFWGQAAIYSLDIFSRLSVLKHYKGWRCVRPRDSPGHRGSPHRRLGCRHARRTQRSLSRLASSRSASTDSTQPIIAFGPRTCRA